MGNNIPKQVKETQTALSSTQMTVHSEQEIKELEPSASMKSAAAEEMTDQKEFIENLRRKEFGLGVAFDPEASSLLRVGLSPFSFLYFSRNVFCNSL